MIHKMYKTKAGALAFLVLVAFCLSPSVILSQKASALSGSSFKAGNIIDDGVFYDKTSMSAQAIQNFLNTKVPTCDTNGTKMYNSTQTRAQYGASKGYPAPYTCLKDYWADTPSRGAENLLCNAYTGGWKSSAQIIYDVSQACNINPQVLIVLLQKEQSLVTDEWPWSIQYRSATGFACPDTAPCDAEYYGFFNQVYFAARNYKKYARDAANYNYRAGRSNNILYHPNTSCGSSSVYITNQATAGLYNYTPYQPNDAALNNLYGLGDDCSSYGNRNFWRIFSEWFGSTTGPALSGTVVDSTFYSDSNYQNKLADGTTYALAPNQIIYVRVQVQNIGRESWDKNTRIGTSNPIDRSSPFWYNWLGTNRTATIDQSSLAPGQIGTVSFAIRAPAKTGTYHEYFNLVIDGRAWLNAQYYYTLDVTETAQPPANYNKHILSASTRRILNSGEFLRSADGYSMFVLKDEGNLHLTNDFMRTWSSNTTSGKTLALQEDGNLVLYSSQGPVWSSSTNNGKTLALQEDGNLVLYADQGQPVWASNTSLRQNHFQYATWTLPKNGIIYKGQVMQTADRRYTLALQEDGNLVLYSPKRALWASNTGNGNLLALQSDGNLVLYSKEGRPVWASNHFSRTNTTMYVQPDGNIVIYNNTGPIWATNTSGE